MTGSRAASRPAFRATDGDERLQVLLLFLLGLCVLAGWILIRALAPAADRDTGPPPGIEAITPGG
ncbi:MAG: hypothetical protein ACM357_00935 [Gemmatimonadota bacterium]